MNKITKLFNIQYPIIQGGMIWNSGYKLASSVSNSGGLGLIGAGSMYPEVLREHIQKCKKATDKPFGVNIPMLYPNLEEIIKIIIEEGVKIVFTSAGNPNTWTSLLKQNGIIVVHIVQDVLPDKRLTITIDKTGDEARSFTIQYPQELEYLIEENKYS